MTTIPIVFVVAGKGGYTWRCEWCKVWHCHGFPLGFRESHCFSPTSPYFHKLYEIRLEPEALIFQPASKLVEGGKL